MPKPPPSPESPPSDRKAVYTIIERGTDKKPFWLRLGVAFVNRDGSLNLVLDALPVNGKLHVRDFTEREDEPR